MYKIIATNSMNWKISGSNFTSRDFPTMLSKRAKLEGFKHLSEHREGTEELQAYNESLESFRGSIASSERWDVKGEKGSEYTLVLDGKDKSINHYWTSRDLDRLTLIAFEHTLKESCCNV